MKVRYIGCQECRNARGSYYKLFISLPRRSDSSEFTTDEGEQMNLRFYGEKPEHIPATLETFKQCEKLQPGSMADVTVETDPFNPRKVAAVAIAAVSAAQRPAA